MRKIALSPGFQLAASKTNGPEPTYSKICVSPGVSATHFGMLKGTFELGLASATGTRPKGSFKIS